MGCLLRHHMLTHLESQIHSREKHMQCCSPVRARFLHCPTPLKQQLVYVRISVGR